MSEYTWGFFLATAIWLSGIMSNNHFEYKKSMRRLERPLSNGSLVCDNPRNDEDFVRCHGVRNGRMQHYLCRVEGCYVRQEP